MADNKNILKQILGFTETSEGAFSSSIKELGPTNIISRAGGDRVIWAIVVILTMMSLLVVYSSTGSLAYKYSKSTESFLFKQFAFIILGVLVIYFAHRVNYTVYSRIGTILFLIAIPLLIYTLFFGQEINKGSRWIKLPVINMTFQTSDLAKLALFMYMSRQLSRKQAVIKDFHKGFLPIIVPVGIICLLVAPANLSTAILIGGTSILLMFIGRVNTKHILATIGIAMIPVLLLITIAMSTYDKQAHKSKDLPSILSVGRVPTWIGRIQTFIYSTKVKAPATVISATFCHILTAILFSQSYWKSMVCSAARSLYLFTCCFYTVA
jgi:cell division protein FtsW